MKANEGKPKPLLRHKQKKLDMISNSKFNLLFIEYCYILQNKLHSSGQRDDCIPG